MASSLPSSYSRAGSGHSYPTVKPPEDAKGKGGLSLPSADGSLAMYVAVVALVISFASLYLMLFTERPLSENQRAALSGIANDLRRLQEREISLSAPVATTIELNRSYPISELFPPNFDIPISFSIPVDTQLVGVSTTGTPIAFRVKDDVPITATIPISSVKAFGNNTIRIQKTLPVEAVFTSIVKVKTAYGNDLNAIIDKIDVLAHNTTG